MRSDPSARSTPVPEGARVLFEQTFQAPLYSAQAPPFTVQSFQAGNYPGWQVVAGHHEGIQLRATDLGLQIIGAHRFSLSRQIAVEGSVRLRVEALIQEVQLTGDASALLVLNAYNRSGQWLGPWTLDSLPIGHACGPMKLTVERTLPASTHHVTAQFRLIDASPQDSLLLSELKCYQLPVP